MSSFFGIFNFSLNAASAGSKGGGGKKDDEESEREEGELSDNETGGEEDIIEVPREENPPDKYRKKPMKRAIRPYAHINDDIADSSDSDTDLDSDTDSIDEAIENGISDEYLLDKIRDFKRGIKDLKRIEHGRLHSDNLLHIPRPRFPKGVNYRNMNSSEDFKQIEFNYPKIKFSGSPKLRKAQDLDIYEFLSMMTEGQKHCPVSRSDFKRLLLARLAPPALGMCNTWMRDKNCTITKLFNRLYKTFSANLTPAEARNLLRKYTFPRNLSFDQALSEFQYLGDYAGRGGNSKEENALVVTFAVQDGLEYGLPPGAYKLCFNQMNDAKRYYGRELYLGELIDSLRQIADKVDLEMRHAKNHNWAKERDFLEIMNKSARPKAIGMSKSNKKFVHEHSVQINEAKSLHGQGGQTKIKSPKGKGQGKGQKKAVLPDTHAGQGGQKGNKVNMASGAKEKKYCSLCTSHTHNASDKCYSIVDNNGKVYEGPPTQEACPTCVRNCQRDMMHPTRLCPLRAEMVKKYKAKLAIPRGIFKAVLEKNNYQVL